jgi:hypothetical protein
MYLILLVEYNIKLFLQCKYGYRHLEEAHRFILPGLNRGLLICMIYEDILNSLVLEHQKIGRIV